MSYFCFVFGLLDPKPSISKGSPRAAHLEFLGAQDLNCLTHEATCLNGKPSPAISRQRLPKAMKAGDRGVSRLRCHEMWDFDGFWVTYGHLISLDGSPFCGITHTI